MNWHAIACFLLLSLSAIFLIYEKHRIYTESLCTDFSIHNLVDDRAHGSVYYVSQYCPSRLLERNHLGRTALAHSIVSGNKELSAFLATQSKLPNDSLDNCGEGYLHLAACSGDRWLVSHLYEKHSPNLQVKSRCNSQTPHQCALNNGHHDVADLLGSIGDF